MNGSDINFFAETTFRRERKKFGIKLDDRRKHMYVIGKTGMGKTNLMANMAIQDIQNGQGVCFIDPHGETAESLLDFIPSGRVNDVIYFNPADLDYPLAFNVMEKVDLEHRHIVSSGLMSVFKKIWPDVWSERMSYILSNTILALLEYPGSTLLGVNRMMSDPSYRQKVVDKITDPVIKAFWTQEYARYNQRYEVEATAAIQNKIGQFISSPLIRNIIGQVASKIDMREIMDSRKILIVNISKGRITDENTRLLGALLITKLQLAAMSRVDVPEEQRQDFFLYVDEFQDFATESFATILSEARKYRLDLTLGHQYITQMTEEVRDAVFGNVGTLICFRVGAEDAEFLEKEFAPDFIATDLVNLGKYDIYLKLMINGLAGRAFSARTLPPFLKPEKSNREIIIKVSRERYGTPRQVVDDKIIRWAETKETPEAPLPSAKELYDAQCETCKKWTKVVFKPDGKRPVYCKICLKKVQREREKPSEGQVEKPPAPPRPLSLEEALIQETVSFSSRRERPRVVPEMEKVKEAIKEALDENSKDENHS
ncbi:MAG: hypothetical protein A2117_02345 [Candidatus Wildermuthbacteria bacterium GWA2_46_15]|uniref:Uncharacterized protein n=1 Tax=Candidatus Wildermuthbacteria bacterium GWA2_46_15 TaxID=1802443 RepID=A0A1G2QN15_9BACT|nr:MAG: hypothetical protein A2117_02345 [Candidatus Wildermuthbacteria bacterium GWA2_46_15]